jgi:hypothetical protein
VKSPVFWQPLNSLAKFYGEDNGHRFSEWNFDHSDPACFKKTSNPRWWSCVQPPLRDEQLCAVVRDQFRAGRDQPKREIRLARAAAAKEENSSTGRGTERRACCANTNARRMNIRSRRFH